MMHNPISITSLDLSFPQKICIKNFSCQIQYGMRIGIIGRNGSGKSTLLKMLCGLIQVTDGSIKVPEDVFFGYVPQVIDDFKTLSGGQRLNAALTQVLAKKPNVLLLDEPTNHLDVSNRRSLMRLLTKYSGSLIVVSHDVEILRDCVDILWHIDQQKIRIFTGNYEDYMREVEKIRCSVENRIHLLERQKKHAHKDLMKEQQRAKKSKLRGEKKRAQGHWPTIVAGGKQRQAQETMGRHLKYIDSKKQELKEKLDDLGIPEVIKPKFSIQAGDVNSCRTILSIHDGGCGYKDPILEGIYLSLGANERLAIIGDNGSGKSTLVRAILGDKHIQIFGDWSIPNRKDIGYLDQHYMTLDPSKTVIETIQDIVPHWTSVEARGHLNDFLFRKNEEIKAKVESLSGGEKARLSLGQIAAQTPKLLILDEMTNNLDLETRNHVIQVLKHYPGAMIVISHDQDFLTQIGIVSFYKTNRRRENK